MSDATAWIRAYRSSHDRFTELVSSLDHDQLTGPSYADDWSIADVASHLGSQAEIFTLFFDSAIDGTDAPGREVFAPIWDRWNALAPEDQAAESIRANAGLVEKLESMSADQRSRFRLNLFGQDRDLAGFLFVRMGEHALHSWDIAVALDPTARLAADVTELLIDEAPSMAAHAGRPQESPGSLPIRTTDPVRSYVLATWPEVKLEPAEADPSADALTLPAEALLRLLAGRLDEEHLPDSVTDDRLDALRVVFPGY